MGLTRICPHSLLFFSWYSDPSLLWISILNNCKCQIFYKDEALISLMNFHQLLKPSFSGGLSQWYILTSIPAISQPQLPPNYQLSCLSSYHFHSQSSQVLMIVDLSYAISTIVNTLDRLPDTSNHSTFTTSTLINTWPSRALSYTFIIHISIHLQLQIVQSIYCLQQEQSLFHQPFASQTHSASFLTPTRPLSFSQVSPHKHYTSLKPSQPSQHYFKDTPNRSAFLTRLRSTPHFYNAELIQQLGPSLIKPPSQISAIEALKLLLLRISCQSIQTFTRVSSTISFCQIDRSSTLTHTYQTPSDCLTPISSALQVAPQEYREHYSVQEAYCPDHSRQKE